MALARWQATIVDEAGNIQDGASIEVRRDTPGLQLVSLFSDRSGLTPLANPFMTGDDGFAAFHVPGGPYQITATKGDFTRVWRYVGIGLAAESDASSPGVGYFFDPLTADANPGDGLVRLNNATLASVTTVYVDNVNAAGADMSSWLDTFDDAGSSGDRGNILISAQGGASFVLGTVTGSIVDGTGYRKISVTVLASAGAFVEDESLSLSFLGRGVDGGVSTSGTIETDAIVQAASSASIKTTMASYAGDLDSLAGAADKFSVRRVTTGATNAPSAALVIGSHVITHVWDTNAARQIYLEFGTTRMWTRMKSSAVWGSWSKIFNEQDIASDAEIRSAAAATASNSMLIQAPKLESAAAAVTLTETAGAVAVDWDTFINGEVVVDQNSVISNPTNGQPGTWRTIYLLGNDATDRTITFGNQFLGELPTITDADSGRAYLLTIFCRTASHFVVSAKRALG